MGFVLLFAGTGLGQEAEIRKLERLLNSSPRQDLPTFRTEFVSLDPQNQLDLGFTGLNGFLGTGLVWDDNVFLTNTDALTDQILLISPGLAAETYVENHRIALSYNPTLKLYRELTDLNYWDQDARGDIRLDFLDAFIGISDHFQNTQNPRNIAFTSKVDRTRNLFTLQGGIITGYLGFGAAYDNEYTSYGDAIPPWQDYTSHSLRGYVQWGSDPHLKWSAEYRFNVRNYRQNVLNDATTNSIAAGVTGDPNESLNYLIQLGAAYVRPHTNGLVQDNSNLATIIAQVSVRAELSPFFWASLEYLQGPRPTNGSNWSKDYRGNLKFTWQPGGDRLKFVGTVYGVKANRSNQPNLLLIGTALGLDYDVTHYLKVGCAWEYRNRTGVHTPSQDYLNNRYLLYAVVYF